VRWAQYLEIGGLREGVFDAEGAANFVQAVAVPDHEGIAGFVIASDALRVMETRVARAGWGFAPRSPVSRSEHDADRARAHRAIAQFGACG
jgi:hypothetical protein